VTGGQSAAQMIAEVSWPRSRSATLIQVAQQVQAYQRNLAGREAKMDETSLAL
jgi:hypothetical protein